MKTFLTIAVIFIFSFLLYGVQPTYLSVFNPILSPSPTVPPSLNWDETSLGYNAYSVLKTGKDEWGKSFPISFEAFGDYKLPGYIYTLIPFIHLFGLNDFAVRFPSLFFGAFSSVMVFLIGKRLLEKSSLALIAALLFTISPWHFFQSRIALEANLALSYFLIGLYFLLQSEGRRYTLLLASLFFGITIFTYNSARVFVPLFLITYLILFKDRLFKARLVPIFSALVISIFILIASYQAIFIDSNSRYYWVSIVDQGALNSINEQRGSSDMPYPLPILLFNKQTYFIEHFVKNYINHLSPDFLFYKGGSQYQFSLPGHGMTYILSLPFLLLGLIDLKRYGRKGLLIIGWIIFAIVPAAITRDSPHALRSVFIQGALELVIAVGIIKFFELINLYIRAKKVKGALIYLVTFCYIASFLFYAKDYFTRYPIQFSQSWQYGIRQALEAERELNVQNLPVVITKKYGEPHIYSLFYSHYDPLLYQTDPSLVRYKKTNWTWVDRFDRFRFADDDKIIDITSKLKDAFLITTQGNYPSEAKLITSVYFLDGTVAFDIVAIRSKVD